MTLFELSRFINSLKERKRKLSTNTQHLARKKNKLKSFPIRISSKFFLYQLIYIKNRKKKKVSILCLCFEIDIDNVYREGLVVFIVIF